MHVAGRQAAAAAAAAAVAVVVSYSSNGVRTRYVTHPSITFYGRIASLQYYYILRIRP